tara:strand:- start:1714 stop:1890 length:177 start_codon:yes stop_codon:yes gene_type:complete
MEDSYTLPSHLSGWFLSMLRIFQLSDIRNKQSLPPVRGWMENSDILTKTLKVNLPHKT